MSRMELYQRQLLDRRTFELDREGVQVEVRNLLTRRAYKVPFETIGDQPVEYSQVSPFWIGLGVVLAVSLPVLALLGFGWGRVEVLPVAGVVTVALVALCTAHRVTTKSFIALPTGDMPLELLANRPTSSAVADFIQGVVSARNDCMVAHHTGRMGGSSAVESIERLSALRSAGAITEEEYDRLKKGVMATVPGDTPPVAAGNYL